jgi:DNA-binding response OmpR family regulator
MARILVVDDDNDILKVVEKVLSLSQHNVFTARDAIKAMDLLNTTYFDVLITDGNMPHFSGFELASTIKNNKRFEKMAICMLTGMREKKDIEKGIRAGVDEYIVKPIDPMLLLQKIDAILVKKPPQKPVEHIFSAGATYANTRLSYESRITQLSETGLTIRSIAEIQTGVTVQMTSDLFRRIDIKAVPDLKVIACRKVADHDYEIQIAFNNVNEGIQKKIRNWIDSQSLRKKDVA